jgi:hypothetical protein
MPGLHQIQLRYDPLEDRALLRMTTTDRNEFRFWITRRYARLLWAALNGAATRGGPAAAQPVPQARQAVMAFEHEAAVSRADFATRFQDQGLSTPLGAAPLLLVRIKCAPMAEERVLLSMHPQQGQGIEVRLDRTLLHSFMKLLTEAARAGEWDLDMHVEMPQPGGAIN